MTRKVISNSEEMEVLEAQDQTRCPSLPGPELGPSISATLQQRTAGCYGEEEASWNTKGHVGLFPPPSLP